MALAMLAPNLASADVRLAEPDTAALSQGLVGYWSMNGNSINWTTNTIQDLSGKGDTGTLVNMSTTSSAVAGKIGGALSFNSSSAQEVSLGTAPSALVFAYNQPFTISMWAKPSATVGSGVHDRLFSIAGNAGQFEYFVMANNNAFSFNVGKNNTGDISITSSFTVGQWYHIVGVYDGTNVSFYVNGVKIGSSAYTYGALSSATGIVSIGGAGSTSTVFNGIIDDVRVYNRALQPQEVQMLYEVGTFDLGNTPATNSSFSIDQSGLNSGLVGYWPLDGDTTNWNTDTTNDVSGNGNAAALFSMSTTSSPVAGVIGGALYFNGSDYATTTAGAPTLSNSWTMSAWVKSNSNGSGTWYPTAFGFYGTSISYIGVCFYSGDFKMCSDGETGSSGKAFTLGKWYYVTVVYNGSNSLALYENGVYDYTQAVSGTPHWQSSNEISLGNTGFNNGSYTYNFTGDVDDVRAYNRALSAQEINDLYSAGKENIDHSDAVSGAGINTGLVGYWTFDGGTINWNAKTIADVSGQSETLTMNGFNTATNTAPIAGKIGQALKFNDSTQYLSHSNISAFNFGTGDFSVSFWMKPASPWAVSGNTFGIIGQKTSDSYNGWQIYQDSGHLGQLDMRITQQNNFLTNSTIPTGKWTLATFVRKSGNLYWYINGNLDSTGSNSNSISDAGSFYIGYAPTWTAYYPGALDDVRIYNRALSAQEVQQLYQMGR